MKLRRQRRSRARDAPDAHRRAPSQEETLGADLAPLPILQLWPQGRRARSSRSRSCSPSIPQPRKRNLGIYRMHVYDAKTHRHALADRKGRRLPLPRRREARRAGSRSRSHVGADPATLLAAVSPLPEGIDELAFAGFLRGSPTRLTRGAHARMRVPADAEFVIEGFVPAARAPQRGAVRRSLRPLLARRTLPGVPRARGHAPAPAGVPGERRRQAAAGRQVHGRGGAGVLRRRARGDPSRGRRPVGVLRGRLPQPARGRGREPLRARKGRRPRSGCSAPGSSRSPRRSCWSTRT